MGTIKELVNKVKVNYAEHGWKETFYKMVYFVKRILRTQLERLFGKTDYLERPQSVSKNNGTVYIITAVPYYDIGGGQRSSQLAKTFDKMGFVVRYLYADRSMDPKVRKLSIPTETHFFINKKSIAYVKRIVKKEDIFIFESPMEKFEPLLDIAVENKCKIVYENIDNWETSLGADFLNEKMLVKLLSEAQVLVGTAKPLVKQLEQYLEKYQISHENKTCLYLANAVDEEIFCGKKQCDLPADLVRGTKTFVYYGSLWGEWFAWDMIIGLAEANPEYSINLIGNTENIQKIVRECPENIHFLGLKAQKDLPAYLQYSDYALLPFKRGSISDYVSPLKIFEYIAMYTKVLSTSLPDIEGYPNVYFGDTVEEWTHILEQDAVTDRETADQFINKNTWGYRISMMLDNLQKMGK